MHSLLQIFKDIAQKFGLSPTVLYLPLAILALAELAALEFTLHPNIKEFLEIAPILMVGFYLCWYLIAIKSDGLKRYRLFHGDEKTLLKKSFIYSLITSIVAVGASIHYINSKNTQADAELYHISENGRGVAIASIDYEKTGSSDETDEKGFQNILNDGFINPLKEVFSLYYEENMPTLTQLPKTLPENFTASLLNAQPQNDYAQWAGDHGYDIAVWGNATKGDSDQYMLDLDFEVLSEPQTVSIKSDDFSLNYTISNYDNDSLVASFDNMVQEIGGITLYLDGSFDDAERIFESLVKSIERELEDFSDENAETEIERKKFERKRSKLNKNLGIVYFYLGNNYLLSGRDLDAEYAYTKAQELSGLLLASADDIEAGEELSMEEMAWKDELANNLSVAFVKNEKLEEAEQILENVEADEGDHPILAQNLGLIYLEQGMKQGIGNSVVSSSKTDSGASKSTSSKAEEGVDDEDKGNSDSKVYSGNENFKKAQEIFAKLEAQIATQTTEQEQFIQTQVAQNVYRNNGILSMMNQDYDKAKDYFEKEIKELKNEKQELMKKRKKVQKQAQIIQQQQQVQMPNNIEELPSFEGDLEGEIEGTEEFFDDEWEKGEEYLAEEEEEAYRLLRKVKQQLEEEVPYLEKESEGDLNNEEEWGEWKEGEFESELEVPERLIPSDFSGNILSPEPEIDEEERRLEEERLEKARLESEEEERRELEEQAEQERLLEEKRLELERLESIKEEMERKEEASFKEEAHEEPGVSETHNIDEFHSTTESKESFDSHENINTPESSGTSSYPLGGSISGGSEGGGERR